MRLCSNCHNHPVFGTDRITKIGYCKGCQYKRTDLDRRSITVKGLEKAKKKAGFFDINKVDDIVTSGVSIMDETEIEIYRNEELKKVGGAALHRWFADRHSEMTGFCKHCGGKTQKGETNYINSICHLLPKAYFNSIATHPSNWIELCFYSNSCHTNMDNKILDLTEMNCWDEIVTKFCIMYPSIVKEERRRIPSVLMQYIETEI